MNEKFRLGAYFIVIPTLRADCMDKLLIPDKFISVSNCICDVVPATWGLEWVTYRENDIKRAKDILKLEDKQFSELERWVTKKFNENLFGWPYGFTEISVALEFESKFLSRVEEAYIVSIGLREDEAMIFLEEEKPQKDMGKTLVYKVLEKNIKMSLNDVLGYDVLGYDFSNFHSYLCNGLERDFYKDLNIKPNKNCLYDTYEQAEMAVKYLNNEHTGAEPVLWQPWIVCLNKKIING